MEVQDAYRPPQADMDGPPPLLPAAPQVRSPFFQTSPQKMAVLSVATLGLYQLFWFHKQWYRRKAHGEDVIPILRTIFAVLFAYSLFQTVNREVARRLPPDQPLASSLSEPLNAGGLALGFFVLALLSQLLPGLLALAGLLSVVPLMIVQKKMNELHAEMGFDANAGANYGAGAIVALVIGGLWWLLMLIGLFAGKA